MSVRLRRLLWTAAFCAWGAAVGGGLLTLWSYSNAPGPAASAPASWPESSHLPRPRLRPALVVALHPQCPCSRATVSELTRLLAHRAEQPDVHLLFVAPPNVDDSWVRSGLWHTAAGIPGVHIARDDGTEARRFGARVSGQVLVYDAGGRLQFSGGITGARGHEGDNAGRAAIAALLEGRPHAASTFVFGCLLFDGDGNAAAWVEGAA
jgi:hypothetical protein